MALSVPHTQLYNVTPRDQNGSRAGSATDFLKRPLHNGHVSAAADNTSDSERDLEPATKMRCSAGATAAGGVGAAGGGGGRRKQSKPIRVRADVDVEVPPTSIDQDSKIIAENDSLPADSASPDTIAVGPTVEADEAPVPLDVFPTKYHQLGNELKQGAEHSTYLAVGATEVDRRNGTDLSSPAPNVDSASSPEKADQRLRKSPEQFSPPQNVRGISDQEAVWKAVQNRLSSGFFPDNQLPDWHPQRNVESFPADLSTKSESTVEAMTRVTSASRLPMSDDEMMRPDMIDPERGWDGGIEKSRIFHPDAYCNICDREFCNKYFLKTHRANKHGIYDGTDGVPGGPPVSLPGSATGLPSFPLPLPPQQHEPPPTTTTTAPPERQYEPLKSASSVAPTPTLSLSNMLPVPQLPPNLGMLSFEETNPPPARNTDMEDYCDICQKHFCNKYYLRKHRQDVHGLSPADVAKRPPVNNVNSSPPQFGHDESAALRSGFVLPRFPLPTSSNAGSMSALNNFMFLPPFASPLVMMPPFLQSGGLGFGPVGAGALSLPRPPVADDKAAGMQFSPDSSTPLPIGSANGGLPGVGMLSPEACLELYQKELMKFNRYLMNSGGEHDPGSAFNTSPSTDNPLANLPRFPSISSSRSDGLGSSDRSESTDTFAEMLQRIGSRFTSKSENYDSLTSELMRMNGVGFDPASGFPGLCPTSAPSSRLVDRVVCDICNKEVCNKYFLKTHKMKVHGWDPNSSSSAATSTAECSPVKSEPASSSHREPSTPPQVPAFMDMKQLFPQSDKPLGKDADLQQMGIDPEAYCDICRKEFCSKYFLRTHRQNIHGIRDTSRASSPGGLLSQPPVASSVGLFSVSASQLLASLPSSIQTPLQSSIPPPLMSVSSSYPLYATADSNSGDGLSSDQRSWKWKEPVNATRVSCNLCNKVLCNKYFLRTHMAKRHGIGTDARIPPPSSQLLPSSVVKDEGGRVIQEYQMPTAQSVPSSVHNSAFSTPDTNSNHERFDIRDIKKEMSPDAAFKSSSSGSGAINLVVSGRSSVPTDVQTVTARTWQVPSEDSSPAVVNTDVPSSPSNNNNNKPAFPAVERDGKKCPMCDTSFTERETLLRHLDNVHQITASDVLAAIQNATHSFLSSPSTTTSSPNNAHQSSAASLSPASSGGIRRRRQFRCAHCRERFRTRVHCELHARAAHPRSSAACIEVTTASDVEDHVSANPRPSSAVPNLLSLPTASLQKPVESKSLPPTPIYATPIDSADPSRFCMQPFILQETLSASGADSPPSPHFSTALVYLPTLRPITEPTSVTFTLTPIMQP